jgi:hypothetical protein
VQIDGRARGSNWSLDPDEISARLDQIFAGDEPSSAPEFDATAVDLDIVRKRDNGQFQAVGIGQLRAMERQPLVRIPDRLFGIL